MALITYADKSAMGTQPSIPAVNKVMDSDMNEIKNAVNSLEASYCLATTTSSSSISSNFFVPINNIYGMHGNYSLEDGGIKIGAGINVIKVSGNIFIDENPTSPSYVWGKIWLIRGNQTTAIATTINSAGNCSFMSTPIPTSLIGVQEGDIIKLMADCGSGGKIRPYVENTWLFVEKVA